MNKRELWPNRNTGIVALNPTVHNSSYDTSIGSFQEANSRVN